MSTEEIKKQSHIHTKNIANGIDTSEEYLAWFNTVPEQMKDFAREVFEIFEKLNTNQIDINMAKELYDKAVALAEV